VPGTIQRVAGSALITAGLTLAGVELFTLIWQIGAPGQFELIARGGDLLPIVLSAILLGAVTLTMIIVWRWTHDLQLGFAQRFLLPGLAAVITGYLATSVLGLWLMVPIGLANLVLREAITWVLVGGAVWIGVRLVRKGSHERRAAA
jgi:hypothetical protein